MTSSSKPFMPNPVRIAKRQDVRRMTEILFDGLKGTKYFDIVYPSANQGDWIEILADYSAQYVDDPNSIALVYEDSEGIITGVMYGRSLSKEVAIGKRQHLDGTNLVEYGKMDDKAFQDKLIDSYGSILCKSCIMADGVQARQVFLFPSCRTHSSSSRA